LVTDVTISAVPSEPGSIRWLVLIVRIPPTPSRHRVAVWRELRRIGALSLGQGSWVVPDVPAFADGVARVIRLSRRGEGEVVVLDASGRSERDAVRLAALFTAERGQEWAEFLAACDRFEAAMDKEISNGKFTLAGLDAEEQGLERLRRWHRELRARDVFGDPASVQAALRLASCDQRLADYTERVLQILHM
jgi:hypothetical protein